ncbi:Spc98 family-domain-containing protein [Phellopilus nigrolimitatus]|nr:Spc98 family-domain-containing protein [Phellopilus nigrolimitatus]
MDPDPEPLSELGMNGLTELGCLPMLWSPFSMPKLVDKPQNPIINTIEHFKLKTHNALPSELLAITEDFVSLKVRHGNEPYIPDDFWNSMNDDTSDYKNRIASWDTLRRSYQNSRVPSPFITEQAPHVVAAAMHRAQPRLLQDDEKIIYLSTDELLDSLTSTLAGYSSLLHVWDVTLERFVPAREGNKVVRIILDGMDETVSESYIARFVIFGTLLRRIEALISYLRRTVKNTNSTIFGFAHALSSTIVWIRTAVAKFLSGVKSGGNGKICDIWVSFQETEQVLLTVAEFCSRNAQLVPETYAAIPHSPPKLLSHIYDFLYSRFEHQAPRIVLAILSNILTITCRPYFQSVAQSIGLEGLEHTLSAARRKARRARDEAAAAMFGDADEEYANDDMESEFENDIDFNAEEFPSFVPEDVKEAIIRARRSITILSSPELDEGDTYALNLPELQKLEWVWTDGEIQALAHSMQKGEPSSSGREGSAIHSLTSIDAECSKSKYKPELARFAVFDMEPGSIISDSFTASIFSHAHSLSSFVASYPDSLPSLTPTLPLLVSHILAPIRAQAAILGRAALRIFFDPGSTLHLRVHVVLLRAYILLAAPAFKARLSAALFSDSEADGDDAEENSMAITIRTRDRNYNWRAVRAKTGTVAPKSEKQPWAVGLAFGLTDRAEWPPGGSDLSFYLRRVIMDSLEHVRGTEDAKYGMDNEQRFGDAPGLGTDEFWDEAESRLGFAIRDLPVGTGRDKWLDPTSIEALDFLFMDYKPPRPLRCLITADILSKYQRVFAFLLRLLRVENAMRLLYRLARPSSTSLFENNPVAANTLLHFRFAAQAFVSALSAYVADTAVRGNLDAFLARLRAAEAEAASSSSSPLSFSPDYTPSSGYFADVYALMKRHSRVLDDVLAACLLRSAQRAVGDVLRACLEVLLEFGVLIGNVYKRMVEEGPAAARLEALYAKFRGKLGVLLKALRKISQRDSKGFTMERPSEFYEHAHGKEQRLPSAPGGMEALSNLLLRLNDTSVSGKI